MRIAVCTPHTGMIRAKCAQALNELIAYSLGQSVVPIKFGFFYEEAGPLEYKRTRLAMRALEWGADYHLLIDWDHTFPPDALLRLAQHGKPMVGTNYPTRHAEGVTAYDLAGEPTTGQGLEMVGATGLGLCLIGREVFEAAAKPWFRTTIHDDGRFGGEDVHFCQQVRAAGIPVHVDHGLIVGHIAETILTLDGEGASVNVVLPAAGNI